MDRFIASMQFVISRALSYLKSNMDRFIDIVSLSQLCAKNYLKSNMDRFIVATKRNKNSSNTI